MKEPALDLALLTGLNCWGAALAADMLTLQIGPPRPSRSAMGRARNTGAWALHVQGHRSVVDGDRPVDDPVAFLQGERAIRSVRLEADGRLTLHLDGDVALRIVPDGSTAEQWRLFAPGRSGAHLVWEQGRLSRH
jgi:hypothetical protein